MEHKDRRVIRAYLDHKVYKAFRDLPEQKVILVSKVRKVSRAIQAYLVLIQPFQDRRAIKETQDHRVSQVSKAFKASKVFKDRRVIPVM